MNPAPSPGGDSGDLVFKGEALVTSSRSQCILNQNGRRR